MATYYWVGGAGTWNSSSTTNWASSSGGPGGAGVPTSIDDAYFDGNSDVGAGFTVTISTGAVCKNVIVGDGSTVSVLDQTMTLAGSATWTVSGSMYLPATNFTRTFTGNISFISDSANTINTNGIAFTGTSDTNSWAFSGSGNWTLNSAISTRSIAISSGSFDTANYNITTTVAFTFSSTGSLTLGSSIINCSGVNGWTFSNGSIFSGTSTINVNGSNNSGTRFFGGGKTYFNVVFTFAGNTARTIDGENTFNNFTIAAQDASRSVSIILSSNQTITGTFSVQNGNTDQTRRIIFRSDTQGTPRTITAAAVVFGSGLDFRDIVAAGASAPWDVSLLQGGDCQGNSNITFPAPKTVYRIGTGNFSATQWAATSGGTPAVDQFPLAQDTMVFDANTTTGTHTVNASYQLGSLNMSASSVVTLATGTNLPGFYGNITLGANVTISGTGVISVLSRTTSTITSAGKTFTQPITISSFGGTVLLADNLSLSATLTLEQGTLNLNDFSATCTIFSSTGTLSRTLAFESTGKVVSTGSGTTVINIAIATNFVATGTTRVELTYAGSTGTRTISIGTTVESSALSIYVLAGSDVIAGTINGCKNLDFTGFSGTLVSASRTIYGDLTLSPTMTITSTTTATIFAATSGTQTIYDNGLIIPFSITVASPGAIFQLTSALTIASDRTFTLTSGTLDLNGFDLTTGLFSSSNSNVRTIAFGANKIELTGSNTTIWNQGTIANFSYTGTSRIECSYAGSTGTRTITMLGASLESQTLNFYITAGSDTINYPAAFQNLDFTGFTGIATTTNSGRNCYGDITYNVGMSVASTTGTLNFLKTIGVQKITTNGVVIGHPLYIGSATVQPTLQMQDALTLDPLRSLSMLQGELDLNGNTLSVGFLNIQSSYPRTVSFGGADIYLTGSGGNVLHSGTAATLTYIGTPNYYLAYAGSTGTRTVTQTTYSEITSPNLFITAGADIISISVANNTTFTAGFTGTATLPTYIYGNVTLNAAASGIVVSTTVCSFIGSSGTQTLISDGLLIDRPITVATTGSTVELGDALTIGSTRRFSVNSGTFNTNNYNLTCGGFVSSTNIARTINLGSSIVTCSSSSFANGFGDNTNLTFNCGTSKLVFLGTGTQGLIHGGQAFYDVEFANAKTASYINIYTNNYTPFVGWTCNNLTFGDLTSGPYQTSILIDDVTVNGLLDIQSSANSNERLMFRKVNFEYIDTASISAASVSTLSNIDFNDIDISGASAPWSGTNLGNGGFVTGVTFDPPKTVYWSQAAGGNWSDNAWSLTSGGIPSSSVWPLLQDVVVIDDASANSGVTINIDSSYATGELAFSSRTLPITLDVSTTKDSFNVFGNIELSPAITIDTGAAGLVILGNSAINTVKTNNANVEYFAVSSNYQKTTIKLLDNITVTDNFLVYRGWLDLNGHDLTCKRFVFTNNSYMARNITANGGSIFITGDNDTVISGSYSAYTYFTDEVNMYLTYAGSVGTRTVTIGSTYAPTNPLPGQQYQTYPNVYVTAGSDTIATGGYTHFGTLDFTGFSGSLTATNKGIHGNLILSQTMTMQSGTAETQFNPVDANPNVYIQTNGVQIPVPILIYNAYQVVGAKIYLADDLTFTSGKSLRLAGSDFDANNKNITVDNVEFKIPITEVPYTVFLGDGTWTVGANWNVQDVSLVTIQPEQSTIDMAGSTAKTFTGGLGMQYNIVNQGGSGDLTFTDSGATYRKITNTVMPSAIKFAAGTTNNVGDLDLAGDPANQVTFGSDTPGSTFTMNKVSGNYTVVEYTTITDSIVAPSGYWYAPLSLGNVNGGNNTGWSFADAPTQSAGFMMLLS